MEHSVKLARLPEKVIFPDRLRDRITFDPANGQLSYEGFMTKCTYDELAALNEDVEYRRALEHLFVLTSEEVAPRSGSRSWSAAIALAAAAALLVATIVVWAVRHPTAEKSANSPATTTVSAQR